MEADPQMNFLVSLVSFTETFIMHRKRLLKGPIKMGKKNTDKKEAQKERGERIKLNQNKCQLLSTVWLVRMPQKISNTCVQV